MLPAIFGIAGPDITADERAIFREYDPVGFILFRRNVIDAAQLRRLTHDLRAAVGRADALVLVDQEGGRVQRLAPPLWPQLPPQGRIGAIWRTDPALARRAAWLLARIIAADTAACGFDTVCAPCLDLRWPQTHVAIGDRAFGDDPETVIDLGREIISGLKAGGILPVIKHLPGHGRASLDSHFDLPVIEGTREDLDRTDFRPFRELGPLSPLAMTGHLMLPALDPDLPSTLSRSVIENLVRTNWNYDGFLMSDDIDMKALSGAPGEIARAALAAGCDGVLQCSGNFETIRAVCEALPEITADAARRLATATASRTTPQAFDREQGLRELLGIVA
ncbi:MAG: beta-N-acetylhexosaminidase [Pseudomonadota bacterium]|nr:beta-N-acetylhexosaminidase [Pseudomonadota bacterium]